MILTERQLEVLRFIVDYRRERLVSPTLEEIARHFDVSKITIFEQVDALVAKGALRKSARKRRGLEILVAPADLAAALERVVGGGPVALPAVVSRAAQDQDHDGTARDGSAQDGSAQDGSDAGGAPPLQILGRIAAGSPIEAIETPEEWTLEDLIRPGRSHYLLRVQGRSMIEDHIQDGDLVVVEHRTSARDGEIVVAVLDSGEATLKRLYREGAGFRLQPANQELEPMFVDHLEVRGVVVGVVRRLK